MITKRAKKPTIDDLIAEVQMLRSYVIGLAAARDPEGEYRPEFVKRILKASKEPAIGTFKDAKSFLKLLNDTK